jgi:PEP-CTERM motif
MGEARRTVVAASPIPQREEGSRMKKLILCLALLSLPAVDARAGIVLSTSNPPGTPLTMAAGTTSGPMLVDVVSNNPPNDVVTAWNLGLEIVGDPGSSGTLTFQQPASGTPANPSNYLFGSDGLGISVTNSGSKLTANDFFNPNFGSGAPAPGAPGANLLQMDFLASSNASGLFGIYAIEGAGNTQWTDAGFTTQFFTNVPNGTGMVRIGDVLIPQVVPEPSSIALLGLGGALLAVGLWQRQRRRSLARQHLPEPGCAG